MYVRFPGLSPYGRSQCGRQHGKRGAWCDQEGWQCVDSADAGWATRVLIAAR